MLTLSSFKIFATGQQKRLELNVLLLRHKASDLFSLRLPPPTLPLVILSCAICFSILTSTLTHIIPTIHLCFCHSFYSSVFIPSLSDSIRISERSTSPLSLSYIFQSTNTNLRTCVGDNRGFDTCLHWGGSLT